MEWEIIELDGKKYVVVASVLPKDREHIVKIPEGSYDRKEVMGDRVVWLKEYVEEEQATEG